MKTYSGYITILEDHQVIVFGSNPEGRHSAGTAKIASEHFGAKYGQGRGLMGQSYGLITKNLKPFYFEKETQIEYEKAGFRSVSPELIVENIIELYSKAEELPNKEFLVAYTASNKNLNGYSAEEMALFFASAPIPNNIVFNEDFAKLIIEKQEDEDRWNF